MRFATIRPDGAQSPEITVVMLAGAAGGELANVNRWRGQVNLGPIDQAGLASARKTLATQIGLVAVHDFAGQGPAAMRMVAALWTDAAGNSWFLKTTGATVAVDAVKPGILTLLETLRFE